MVAVAVPLRLDAPPHADEFRPVPGINCSSQSAKPLPVEQRAMQHMRSSAGADAAELAREGGT